ncbi:hypothetical protein K0M31_012656 [Melipona bicolor]|uniref:Uncharacterized protein n=1 Tax=Melipona bicolor TaxID=60889 RepID=A0AA40FJZ5_9HYME|nr:hypothetical protein K0M31_012656 [Melipona bicolor]
MLNMHTNDEASDTDVFGPGTSVADLSAVDQRANPAYLTEMRYLNVWASLWMGKLDASAIKR